MIKFLTNDEKSITVTQAVARQSKLVDSMLGDEQSDEGEAEIPLLEVNFDLLTIIIKFLEHHVNDPYVMYNDVVRCDQFTEIASEWDAGYVKDFTFEELVDLAKGANYMDIDTLNNLLINRLSFIVNDSEYDKVKEFLGVEKDLTIEEERRIRDQNPWIIESL